METIFTGILFTLFLVIILAFGLVIYTMRFLDKVEPEIKKAEIYSTKICPKCGNKNLLLFTSLNLKSCPNCFTDIPWKLGKKQRSLH